MNKEQWLPIKDYEDIYQISNYGRLRRISSGKILIPRIDSRGHYYRMNLCVKNVRVDFLLHRIVGKHFISNPDNKLEINHLDGNKANNHASNLEWVTSQENKAHARRLGLTKPCPSGSGSKLSRADVDNIRFLRSTGIEAQYIADQYGVTRNTIYRIQHGQRWKS